MRTDWNGRHAGVLYGILASLLLIVSPAMLPAQSFWEKKPYQEWSKSDCDRLLKDSPWTTSYAFSRVIMTQAQSQQGRGDDRDRETNPEVRYRVQLRSSIPVRRALVRLAQLDSGYQKLTPEQKGITDQDAEKLLAEKFDDLILVHVEYTTNVQGYALPLERQWQTRSVADLRNATFLINSRGDRVSPARFRPSPEGGGFDLFFPRLQNGEPVVNKNDKTLKIEFPHPGVGVLPAGRVLVEFRVPKMVIDSQLTY